MKGVHLESGLATGVRDVSSSASFSRSCPEDLQALKISPVISVGTQRMYGAGEWLPGTSDTRVGHKSLWYDF
ncbi:hypothetical protein M413DRAFT_448603 [Hebeloma cylindrosporum]|uniref:Uncharacterized protein n=1 Tax=Hebeloma cylindrosporum TaxID=76867 RepID=A0A0C3BKR7_HEBCY|nr:hypothetical protein M413DRAFT_448603 [Hebeloma cylindrosporum h7]